MKKKIMLLTCAIGLISSTSAFAAHEHYIVTPGTTVCDVAKGQTSIDDSDNGGYHKFHENVYMPAIGSGSIANGQTTKVSVYKGECPAD
jgi:hypothetical protein